ncbi:MAG: hypothetical protein U0T69_03180 [Chitinophagales bacterium]
MPDKIFLGFYSDPTRFSPASEFTAVNTTDFDIFVKITNTSTTLTPIELLASNPIQLVAANLSATQGAAENNKIEVGDIINPSFRIHVMVRGKASIGMTGTSSNIDYDDVSVTEYNSGTDTVNIAEIRALRRTTSPKKIVIGSGVPEPSGALKKILTELKRYIKKAVKEGISESIGGGEKKSRGKKK